MPSIRYIMQDFNVYYDTELGTEVIWGDSVLDFVSDKPIIFTNLPDIYELETFIQFHHEGLPTDDEVINLLNKINGKTEYDILKSDLQKAINFDIIQGSEGDNVISVDSLLNILNAQPESIDANKAYLSLIEKRLQSTINNLPNHILNRKLDELKNDLCNKFAVYDKQKRDLLKSKFELPQLNLNLTAKLHFDGKNSYFTINEKEVSNRKNIYNTVFNYLESNLVETFIKVAKDNHIILNELPNQEYNDRYYLVQSLTDEQLQKIKLLLNTNPRQIEWTYSNQLSNLNDEKIQQLFQDFDTNMFDFKHLKLSESLDFFDGLTQVEKIWQKTLLEYDSQYKEIEKIMRSFASKKGYRLTEPETNGVTLIGSDNNQIVLSTYLNILNEKLSFKDSIVNDINQIIHHPLLKMEILEQLLFNNDTITDNKIIIDIKNKYFSSENEFNDLSKMIVILKEIDINNLIQQCSNHISYAEKLTEKQLSKSLVQHIINHSDFIDALLDSPMLKAMMDVPPKNKLKLS